MSVVVAIKDNDRILVGCDSQVTQGYTKAILTSQMKIWKPKDNNNIVMGGVGFLRDLNILSTTEEWIDELPELKDEVNFKYIVRTIVPKVFKELDTFGRLRYDCGIKSIESNFIFAYKNKAFQIERDGCVTEIKDILIDGSGNVLSLGVWNEIKDKTDLSAEDKMIKVIKSACESDLYVNYPIVIMNTKDNEIKIIER